MRVLLSLALATLPLAPLIACSCVTPGTPCAAAGLSAAVFTGTVLDIADPAPAVPRVQTGSIAASRRAVGDTTPLLWPLRVVRIQVGEVLSGIDPAQKTIEIVTGMGGGDCGYAFQPGVSYIVYAYKNSRGLLQTGICSRTRPLAQATEDLEYLHAMAGAPATGTLRVRTRFGNTPGKPGMPISADGNGSRYHELTNDAGEAVFTGLPPDTYTIHGESDGALPDDPVVELRTKGCLDVTLLRTLRISGRVATKNGVPAGRIEIQLRSVENRAAGSAMTGPDGRYELRLLEPGRFYLGINLNHTATADTPYARWFYPGTDNPAAATPIDFSGRPDARTYDLTLPDRQPERVIDGIVLMPDGQPKPRAVVTVLDGSRTVIAQGIADQSGRFAMQVFANTAYRLHTVWPGNISAEATSAVPFDIQPGSTPLSLRLTLTESGNSYLDGQRHDGIHQ